MEAAQRNDFCKVLVGTWEWGLSRDHMFWGQSHPAFQHPIPFRRIVQVPLQLLVNLVGLSGQVHKSGASQAYLHLLPPLMPTKPHAPEGAGGRGLMTWVRRRCWALRSPIPALCPAHSSRSCTVPVVTFCIVMLTAAPSCTTRSATAARRWSATCWIMVSPLGGLGQPAGERGPAGPSDLFLFFQPPQRSLMLWRKSEYLPHRVPGVPETSLHLHSLPTPPP